VSLLPSATTPARRRNRDHEIRAGRGAGVPGYTEPDSGEQPSQSRTLTQTLRTGLSGLHFPSDLEKQFAADTFPSRRRLLIGCGVIGWIGLSLGSFNNAEVFPDVLNIANQIVLALMCMMGLSLIMVICAPFPRQSSSLYEGITAFNIVLVAAAIIWMGQTSETLTAKTNTAGLISLILYVCIAVRLRFRWAISSTMLIVASYMLYIDADTPVQQSIFEANVRLLLITAALALSANYTFERRDRKTWLLHQLDEAHQADLQRTSDMLQDLSIRDPLTGLYNRRQFEADLMSAWSDASLSGQPVAMLLMDIDHFKRYNDSLGHPQGDICIQKVAQVLQSLADTEWVSAGRLGGEEFGLMLPGRSAEAALLVAQRLCEAVRGLQLPHAQSDVARHVTVSAGVAVAWPAHGDHPDHLMHDADIALYEAKQTGRDRACLMPATHQIVRPALPVASNPPPSEIAWLEKAQSTQASLTTLMVTLTSGFRWLRFPPPIETCYQTERAPERRKHLAFTGIMGIILLNAYALLSRHMYVDVANTAITMQLVVAAILILCVIPVYALPLKPWLSEGLYAAAVSLLGLCSVYTLAASDTVTAHVHMVVLFVIPFFAGVVSRQPFIYTCLPSMVTVTACATLMHPHDALQAIILNDNLFIICNATLYTLIAAYSLERSERRAWLQTQIDHLQHQALDHLSQRLHHLSTQDALTGLNNRRQFEADYTRIWEDSQADQQWVSTLILDVDFFKRYNDNQGHPAGDRCLQQVAQVVGQIATQHQGLAARLGGEEFGILLPGQNLAQAIDVAHAVQQAMVQAAIPHGTSTVADHVTVSVGAASIQADEGAPSRDLLVMADDALYLAKASGRNRVAPSLPSVA
jgi:diguanylate cyclase (GGDEF)-like protein